MALQQNVVGVQIGDGGEMDPLTVASHPNRIRARPAVSREWSGKQHFQRKYSTPRGCAVGPAFSSSAADSNGCKWLALIRLYVTIIACRRYISSVGGAGRAIAYA